MRTFAAALVAGLLVLYGWHQAPLAWATLGLGP